MEKPTNWKVMERIHNLETHKELHEKRIDLLEKSFNDHMKVEEIQLDKLHDLIKENNDVQTQQSLKNADAIGEIKKVVYRIIWIASGVTGTIVLAFAIGKEVIKFFK